MQRGGAKRRYDDNIRWRARGALDGRAWLLGHMVRWLQQQGNHLRAVPRRSQGDRRLAARPQGARERLARSHPPDL
eukprot:8119567-Pyramimonas_sp.AAC.1